MKRILLGVFTVLVLSFCFLVSVYADEAAPQRGGILRCIRSTFPNVLGYAPEMGPVESIFALPYAEGLTGWDENGNQIPILAESWDVNVKNKTLTWHLRKGVKFHDDSPFNAEAVKWNLQLMKDNFRLTDGELVKSIDVIDEYTVRMNLSEITSIAVINYGWTAMYSPTAFKNNGGKEWARLHPVATGPFKFVEFKRDTFIKYEKNPNYWRKGYPLLDGIETRYIPDPGTAAMMMQKKEAEIWQDVAEVKYVLDLQEKGLKTIWGPGMFWALMPNSLNPKSPYANKKVREALEYALDRNAIAKSLGFGKYEPFVEMAPSSSPAFVQNYNPRPYNPEKAKKLLAEAGYPNGFETKLLALDLNKDVSTAIQTYYAQVGIKVDIDTADLGRYFGALFFQGWNDLALSAAGINPDATDIFIHFGPRPMTFKTKTIAKSPEYLALCEKALQTYDPAAFKAMLKKAVKQGTEDAMITPLYRSAQANVLQTYVHSDHMKIHGVTWYVYKDWMEKQK
jgi:peptide/nickel transport system substrate-binding protein